MNVEKDIEKLHKICIDYKFARISKNTVEEAWATFSKDNGSEWLPLYGSRRQIFEHMNPYLPRLEIENTKSAGWFLFFWLVNFIVGCALAWMADYQAYGETVNVWILIGLFVWAGVIITWMCGYGGD